VRRLVLGPEKCWKEKKGRGVTSIVGGVGDNEERPFLLIPKEVHKSTRTKGAWGAQNVCAKGTGAAKGRRIQSYGGALDSTGVSAGCEDMSDLTHREFQARTNMVWVVGC